MTRNFPMAGWFSGRRGKTSTHVPDEEWDFDLRRPRFMPWATWSLALSAALCFAASALAATRTEQHGRWRLPPWPVTLVAGFATLGAAGASLSSRASWNRIKAQHERARRELDTLAEELRRATDDGVIASEMLRQRGYTEFDVRRWIVRVAGLSPLPQRRRRFRRQ